MELTFVPNQDCLQGEMLLALISLRYPTLPKIAQREIIYDCTYVGTPYVMSYVMCVTNNDVTGQLN